MTTTCASKRMLFHASPLPHTCGDVRSAFILLSGQCIHGEASCDRSTHHQTELGRMDDLHIPLAWLCSICAIVGSTHDVRTRRQCRGCNKLQCKLFIVGCSQKVHLPFEPQMSRAYKQRDGSATTSLEHSHTADASAAWRFHGIARMCVRMGAGGWRGVDTSITNDRVTLDCTTAEASRKCGRARDDSHARMLTSTKGLFSNKVSSAAARDDVQTTAPHRQHARVADDECIRTPCSHSLG